MPTSPHLAEERNFAPQYDQPVYEERKFDNTIDWSSDPMEILMAKQELELMELELELAVLH